MVETPDPTGTEPAEPAGAVPADAGEGATPPQKRKWPLLAAVLVVVAIVVVVLLMRSGGVATAPPAEAKSCLEDAGFDTSGETGIISLFAGGKDLEIQDQFPAFRGNDRLAVFFFGSEDDAEAAAGALPSFNQDPAAPKQEAHAVGSATLLVIEGTSTEAVEEVEGCLGA